MNALLRFPQATPLAGAGDEGRFGGKAAGLAAAAAAGLPVPDGYALEPDLVEAVRRGAGWAREEVARVVLALGGPVSVRSSAIGEDSGTSSFAGQHLTRLNVASASAAIAAVIEVDLSARTEAALAYRRRRGIAGSPRMAVVIQRMVEAESAGVLFTRNPIDGGDEIVVEASWGLGEAVVSGLVVPDFHRLDRSGLLLERRIGNKDRALRHAEGGGTREVALPRGTALAACLGSRSLTQLLRLARRCEAVYGSGLDLEFAFAEGRLHLLQCRAITRVHERVAA